MHPGPGHQHTCPQSKHQRPRESHRAQTSHHGRDHPVCFPPVQQFRGFGATPSIHSNTQNKWHLVEPASCPPAPAPALDSSFVGQYSYCSKQSPHGCPVHMHCRVIKTTYTLCWLLRRSFSCCLVVITSVSLDLPCQLIPSELQHNSQPLRCRSARGFSLRGCAPLP